MEKASSGVWAVSVAVFNLSLAITDRRSIGYPVRGVTFGVGDKRVLGIVGESGSGKTLTGLAILRLLPANVRVVRGEIEIDGTKVLSLQEATMRHHRGSTVAMVFQNYRGALNPVFTVSQQLAPVIGRSEGVGWRESRRRVILLLGKVGLHDPERVADAYPHELSGGMAQRVGIALALACRPRLIIADEPGSGLDVLVRSAVMHTLKEAILSVAGSGIVISHDMSLITAVCDDVVVMYFGEVVETGPTTEVLGNPRHPYTRALLEVNGVPAQSESFPTIKGTMPGVFERVSGCPYHPRCPHAMPVCQVVNPGESIFDDVSVRCHLLSSPSKDATSTGAN
jgi:oligopeptide/dipeptide ABC transporter ATP-binding protein